MSTVGGTDFFNILLRYLTQTLGVDFAYVGELTGERHDKVRTLAMCARGESVDNVEYDIAPAPCLIVMTDGFAAYNRDVQRLFPDDRLVMEMGVESYMGIALTGGFGQMLGLLCVMDAKPLRNPKMAELLLRIFATRAATELERMQTQERLHHLAHHDALTELPNRILFLERLNQALQRSGKSERVIGLMFLDLDRFKLLNDTLGHDVGDRFLKGIAARLRVAVREGDTVARLGGDEFAILLNQVAQPEDITLVANKILRVFATPFDIGAHQHYLTVSIGISLYPSDGADAATLLKQADAAMYRAKDLGKNTFQFYSADMGVQALERLMLETSLRHALERNEFVLHYQPQIELTNGRLIGLEALLRWQHPDLGLIGPMQFMHLAEETGLIGPISEWVMHAATVQARAWEHQQLSLPQLAVNLSGVQFHQTNFVETMRRALGEWDLRSMQLEFEITESAIMKDAALTVERLRILHSLGARFAIDDFGTGYSSLGYLKRFPISTLKIDKSFIQDVTTDESDAEIVRTIIGMAHNLKLKVVAEGVETAGQAALLRALGCDAVQGYYFSRTLPPGELEPWLRAGGRPGSGAQRVPDGEGEGKQQ